MTVRGEDDSRDPPASWQYASKCLYSTSPKIWFLLMVGHLGLTPLSTQSINERITLRAANTRDPASRTVFFRNKQLLFILVLATDQGNNGAVRGLWPVQPGFYLCLPHHEPSCVFFLLKMASPVLFFKEIPKQGLLALSALLGCKSFKTRRVSFGLPRNGLYIFKTHQTGNQFQFFFITRF